MTASTPIEIKIAALLAKANSTTSEAEAYAFSAKAAELLQKHNLEMSDIERASAQASAGTSDPIVEVRQDWAYADPWRISIARDVAALFFCKSYRSAHLHTTKSGKVEYRVTFVFVGKARNASAAALTSDYLISTTLRLGRGYSSHRSQQLAFMRGCGEGLARRLRVMAQNAREPNPVNSTSGLPALYKSELQLVDEHMDTLGLRCARKSKGSDLSGLAALEGWQASASVAIGSQLADETMNNPRLR